MPHGGLDAGSVRDRQPLVQHLSHQGVERRYRLALPFLFGHAAVGGGRLIMARAPIGSLPIVTEVLEEARRRGVNLTP